MKENSVPTYVYLRLLLQSHIYQAVPTYVRRKTETTTGAINGDRAFVYNVKAHNADDFGR